MEALVPVIHVIGGSQNELLCRLAADTAQLPVIAGPIEATALHNVLVQVRAHGALASSLEEIRVQVARLPQLRSFQPSATTPTGRTAP